MNPVPSQARTFKKVRDKYSTIKVIWFDGLNKKEGAG